MHSSQPASLMAFSRSSMFRPAERALDGRKITRLPEHFISIAKKQKAQDEVTEPSKRVMVGGKLVFGVMQRVGAPTNALVQTSLAVCHSSNSTPRQRPGSRTSNAVHRSPTGRRAHLSNRALTWEHVKLSGKHVKLQR